MGDILERSLTEMDWLIQLNGFAPSTLDSSESGSCDSNSGLEITEDSALMAAESVARFERTRNAKPPFSYTYLITLAISSTAKKRMALNEIYQWIKDHYPYYKTAAPGWKNSVRHNLSLNKNFVKVARRKDEPGKGAYWALESSVIKKLHSRHHKFTERVPLLSRENAPDDIYDCVYDDETEFAVQTISQQGAPLTVAFSPLDYSDEEEVQAIIEEAELAANIIDSSHSEHGGEVCSETTLGSQQSDWLRTCLNGKIDPSWPAGIDLDTLMTSLKSDKIQSLDHLADLINASALAVHSSDSDLLTSDLSAHNIQHFTELRPLYEPSSGGDVLMSSAEFERYTSIYCEPDVLATELDTQTTPTTCVLDHSSYTFQHPSLSIHRPYPQHTVAVVGRSKMAAMSVTSTGSSRYIFNHGNDDDDIEDDFNWDNLIDRVEERATVATHCC